MLERNSIAAFILTCFVVGCTIAAKAQDTQVIAWGGGGAFTSTTEFDGTMYLASDVAGVWKQVNGQWQPFVEGLDNYNVTALVSFNQWLFAITTDELFVSDGKQKWISTRLKLDTYRSITDQPYSISADKKLLCIASRGQKIDCVDEHNHILTFPTPDKIVSGVHFANTKEHSLYFYNSNKLFRLNLLNKKIDLVAHFNEKIVSMASFEGQDLIATSDKIYSVNDIKNKLYSSSHIVNFFVVRQGDKEVAFIAKGNRWNTQLIPITLNPDATNRVFQAESKLQINFDRTLPHRNAQKSLTKFLSVNQIDGKAWLTDYWGVYQLDFSNNTKLVEATDNAINTVATDLAITDEALYISTMDNGIVKVSQVEDTHTLPEFKALAFDMLKGHSWSLLHHNKSIYGVISPWDNPNDFLFEYSEANEKSSISKLTDFDNRKSKGAFWGNAYSRQLVYYQDILSFRDGKSGGLVINKGGQFESDEPDRLGHLNKVYRSIAVHADLLYIASCEGKPRVLALDPEGELKVLENLPSGFCPYTLYSHQDSLYLLGSRKGQSVIYQLKENDFGLLQSSSKGSAFYQMGINPNSSQQIVTATISWSNKATSGLFVSADGGQSFTDNSCLLSHKNGVAAIKFAQDKTYILQKVGGLLSINTADLFDLNSCVLSTKPN